MVLSYRSAMTPLLPQLAEKLAAGFTSSRQGCYLWATDSIVQEFSEGAEDVDARTTEAIFEFYSQQATTFLRALNDLRPEELPDGTSTFDLRKPRRDAHANHPATVIEDFFRLTDNVLLFYPEKCILSNLMQPLLSAAAPALTLMAQEPVMATLHFLRDFMSYSSELWPQPEMHEADGAPPRKTPEAVRAAVVALLRGECEQITTRVMAGMMYTFPEDCFADASGVLLGLFQSIPQETLAAVQQTIGLVPRGSLTQQEADRLIGRLTQ